VIRPWQRGVLPRFAEIWRYRQVSPYLMREFVAKRYRRTYLGLFWIPLRPALDIASRAFLFGGLLQVGSGDRPYFIFIAFSSAGWQVFDSTLKWGTRVLQRGRGIVVGLHIPRAVTMTGTVGPSILDFITYAAVALVGALYYLIFQGHNYLAPPQQMPIGVFGLVLLLLFGLGVSLFTSPISMITREVRYILGYATQFLYFVTPVVYDIDHIPKQYRTIAEINPLTGPIEMVKYGFLSTAPPTTLSLTSSFIGLVVILVTGFNFFSRLEGAAVDRL